MKRKEEWKWVEWGEERRFGGGTGKREWREEKLLSGWIKLIS